MSRRLLSRRAVLRGAGGAAVALPWLEAMSRPRPARAEARPPRRLIVFFTPNGHPLADFRPAAGVAGGPGPAAPDRLPPVLPPILAPLAAHRARLTLIEGIALTSAQRRGHECLGALLTGTRPGAGPSLDQDLARQLPGRLGALGLGVSVPAAPDLRVHLSYAAAGQPRPAMSDPRLVFDLLFGLPGAGGGAAVRADRRTSVLDGVKANLQRTMSRVSAADRQVLQEHLAAVRALESELGAGPRPACGRPARPGAVEVTDHDRGDELARQQAELLALAFACDASRVATFMLAEAGAERFFRFLGLTGTGPDASWVGLSHQSDAASRTKQTQISTWCARRLADLVTRLEKIPEEPGAGATAPGNALDHTAILWMTECHRDHSVTDLPLLLVSGGQLGVRGDRVLRLPGERSHNDLLLALAGLMERPRASFGNPAHCTGALALT